MARNTSGDAAAFTAKLFARIELASPEVQPLHDLALTVPEWARSIASNPHLTDDVWEELFSRYHRDTGVARALVTRILTPAQLDRVCASRPNSKVASALLDVNRRLSAEQLEMLARGAKVTLAKKLADTALYGWIPIDDATKATLWGLARTAGPARQVALIARGGEVFSTDERREVLGVLRGSDVRTPDAAWDAQLVLWRDRALLDACIGAERDAWLDLRIAGLPVALSLDAQLALAALGDPGEVVELTDELAQQVLQRRYVLLALVNNPVCRREVVEHVLGVVASWLSQPELYSRVSPELLEALRTLQSSCSARLAAPHKAEHVADYAKVTDATQLTWLVSRATPSDFRDRPRPLEALELSYNPNLNHSQAVALAGVLTSYDVCALLGEELCRQRHEQLNVLTGGQLSPWYDRGSWETQDDSQDASRHLAAGSFAGVGQVCIERVRVAAESGYGRFWYAGTGERVSLVDWFMLELYSRVGDDPVAFAACASLLTLLDPDTTLDEVLALSGTV